MLRVVLCTERLVLCTQRVLGGHLEEVGEEDTGVDAEAAGVGKGAGRVNEMRRRGGAFKHGGDATAGAGSHELPPLRTAASMRASGKIQQANPASPGEGEGGGGLSSKVRTRNGFNLCLLRNATYVYSPTQRL